MFQKVQNSIKLVQQYNIFTSKSTIQGKNRTKRIKIFHENSSKFSKSQNPNAKLLVLTNQALNQNSRDYQKFNKIVKCTKVQNTKY